MKIHLIHDSKSGDIVHMHISSDRALTKEDILHKVPRASRKENLGVLTVDELPKGHAFRVDVASKSLIKADPNKVGGFAAGGYRTFLSAQHPSHAKTVYKKESDSQ
jgi:hypothetical protein